MLKLFRDIHSFRELLGLLVLRNIKVRYKNSVLGFFWSFLGPLSQIVIYAIFLRILISFNPRDPHFMSRLVSGIIVWQFVGLCTGDSLNAIVGNKSLITKTAFPRAILPLAMVIANLVNFLLSMVILAVFLLVMKISPDYSMFPVLAIVMLTHFALCLGLALILSCANVFFRDIEHILGPGMLAWFFLTPIIYTVDRIPAAFREWAFLNPMTGIVTGYRRILLDSPSGDWRLIFVSAAVAWTVCIVGLVFFQRFQVRFAEEL